MLSAEFFDRTPLIVAQALLGKVIRKRHDNLWLSASIIETEAYCLEDKASHASLGYTEKRKALFMEPGTIYMYYARGADSLNISCQGEGSAVLIKSGLPLIDQNTSELMLSRMQALNPHKNSDTLRPLERLCNGQTLLCKALGIKVNDWDQRQFSHDTFFIEDIGYEPAEIIQTTRLGIRTGRDEHLPYRFIDASSLAFCTKKPARCKSRFHNCGNISSSRS